MTEAERELNNIVCEVIQWFKHPISVQRTNDELHTLLQTRRINWINEVVNRTIEEHENGKHT